IADEVEIVPLRVPYRIYCIEHVISHTMNLTVRGAPNVDLREPVSIRGHTEGQIFSARRPDVIADLPAGRIDDFDQLAVGERHDRDFSVFVSEGDAFSVG